MKNNEYQFQVSLVPVYTIEKKVAGIQVPNKLAVLRKDTEQIIGLVSPKYQLLTHETVVEGFRKALGGYAYSEKIEMSPNGAKMFIKYTIKDFDIEVTPGDFINLQFIVKNSYDGSNALNIILGAYRVYCTNGMIIGKSFSSFSQKHIGSETGIKVDVLKEKMDLMLNQFKQTLPHLQAMNSTKLVSLKSNWDAKNTMLPKYLMKLAHEKFTGVEEGETVYDYYNAMTDVISHNMKKESFETQVQYGKYAWEAAVKALSGAEWIS